MDELIARLEAATAPDREIDALLWAEIDGRDVRIAYGEVIARKRGALDDIRLGFVDPTPLRSNFYGWDGPEYTASLDAAIALAESVLPGWEWALFRYAAPGRGGRHAAAARVFPYLEQQKGSGDWEGINPAIALCIALLKAKQTQTAQAPKHVTPGKESA